MTKKLLPFIALGLLIGCGKEKSKDDKEAPFVPTQLTFSKPSPGQKLTQEQISETKALLSTNNKLILPPSDLVFATKKMSATEIQQKEENIRAQDANSYALLKDIQSNCQIERPTSKFDATFPTTGDMSLENLRTGDHYNFESTAGIKGDKCPVKYSVGMMAKAYVNDVNQDTQRLKASGSVTYKSQAFMVEPKYQRLLNSRGIVVDSNISGLALKQDAQSNILMTFDLSGTYYSLKHDIPYAAKVQVLSSGKDSGQDNTAEIIVSMSLKAPNAPIQIDIHTKSSANSTTPTVEEYYVNGHQMNKEEFNALFGKENPAMSSTKTLVKTYKF